MEPDEGCVEVGGETLTSAAPRQRRLLRRRLQIVFQDALSSLNPRMTAAVNIAEPMRLQGLGSAAERQEAAWNLLELVGLTAADGERLSP